MADETIGRASIELGADGSKLSAEMAAATAKAQGELEKSNKRIEAAQKKTERSIQASIDRINATKATRSMQNLEKAVERLGGTSKLSANQVARVRGEVERLAKAGAAVPKSLELPDVGAGGGLGVGPGIDSLLRGDIKGALATLGPIAIAATTAAGAVKALGSAIGEVVDKGDSLKDLSSKTGITTEALQKLEYAGNQVGVSMEQTATASRSLQRRLIDMPQNFRELGLDVERLINLKPDEAFMEVAAAISQLPTQAQKSAAAMNLLGDAGVNVLPLLQSNIAAAADEAERLGIVMSAELIDASDRLGDATTRLSTAWDGLKTQLVGVALGSGDAADSIDQVAFAIGAVANAQRDAGAFQKGYLQGSIPILQVLRDIADVGRQIKEKQFLNYQTGPTFSGFFDPASIQADTSPLDLGPATEQQKAALERYKAKQKEVEAAIRETQKAQEEWQRTLDQFSGAAAQAEVEQLGKVVRALGVDGIADLEAFRKKLVQLETGGAQITDPLLAAILKGGKLEIPDLDIGGLNLGDVNEGILDISESLTATGLAAQQQFAGIAEEGKKAGLSTKEIETALKAAGASSDQVKVALGGVTEQTYDWQGALENISNIVQGLPGPLQGIGKVIASIATGFAGIGATLDQFGGSLSGLFKSFSGGLGGILSGISGVGSLATSVIGILGGLGSKIGGLFKKEEQEVNKLRDQFFSEFEGGFVGLQKQLAGTLGAVENQDFVKQIFDAKTVEEFNAAVAKTKGLLDTQQVAQEELNATLEKYGFEKQVDQAKELEAEGAQLFKEFELLTKGGLVPAGEALTAMGSNLSDFVNKSIAAGVAVPEAMRPMLEAAIQNGTLLDENGNAFESLEDAGVTFAQTLTESMAEVVDSVKQLVAALTGIPADVNTNVNVNYSTSGSPGAPPGVPDGKIPGFAGGTQGFQDFGRGTLALLHGREAVIPEQALRAPRASAPLQAMVSAAGLRSINGGRAAGGDVFNFNTHIDEDRFQSAESRRQLRRYTLRTVERESGKRLAALVRAGRA